MSERPTGTITFLFTDIEGSTTRWEHYPDAMRKALARHDALLRQIITTHNGFVFKMVGDAVYAAFAVPADAVSAALAAQHAIAVEAWSEVSPLRVRMALHTGAAQSRDDDYFGPTLNRVARVLSTGYGGQILLSVATVELVRDALPAGASLKDLGEHALKDLLRPEHIFQLTIPDVPSDFPTLKSLTHQTHNLPVQPTPFLGREQEVASLYEMLSRPEMRLLTLTGPGGIGKTRLGLHAAAELTDQFVDGVWFVALAPLSDAELVVPTIMQTLAISETGGQPLLGQLKAALKDKHLLLLLDNFEQVVEAASVVADLLTTCPKLKLIVTSRVVLHLRAEREFSVPALSLPDPQRLPDLGTLSQYEAVALFIVRAQAVKPDFAVTNANAPAVAGICARLDGLPLAIELAAARSKMLPPQALLARLSQRLAMLTSGARDVPARHQTLHNTIAWSYDLLGAADQQLFRRLCVFVGGCTLEAIEAVCATLDGAKAVGSVLDGVGSLIDKSLLRQTEQEDGEPWFMMLETIREFGLEALAKCGEMEATRQAHADYYLALAEKAEPQLGGPQQIVWLERLEWEHDNLRAVMQWFLERREMGQSIEMALRLGATLQQFWKVRGHWREGRNFLEQALVKSEGIEAPIRVKALLAAARLASVQGDLDRTEALCEESLARCRELGDKRGIALSLSLLWDIAYGRGNLGEAYIQTEEALALFKEVGDKEGIAQSLANLAHTVSDQGEYARGIALHEEALALYREAGDMDRTAKSHCCLAEMLFFSQSDPARVHALLEEGLALCTELGHKEGIAWSLALSGWLALSQGDEARARSLIDESLVLYREMGHRRGIARSLFDLGRVAQRLGDYAAARARYEESLAMGRAVGNKRDLASYLEGLAGLFVAQGEPVRAVRLWGAADALRAAMGTPIPPVYRANYEHTVIATRTELGEEAFAKAWAQGRTLSLEQVIEEALKMGR